MAGKVSVRLESYIPQLEQAMRQAADDINYQVAQEILAEAQNEVPVRTGALKGTGTVVPTDHGFAVTYGGPGRVARDTGTSRYRSRRTGRFVSKSEARKPGNRDVDYAPYVHYRNPWLRRAAEKVWARRSRYLAEARQKLEATGRR